MHRGSIPQTTKNLRLLDRKIETGYPPSALDEDFGEAYPKRSWQTVNWGNVTRTYTQNKMVWELANATEAVSAMLQPVSTADFTIFAHMNILSKPTTFYYAGLVLSDSTSAGLQVVNAIGHYTTRIWWNRDCGSFGGGFNSTSFDLMWTDSVYLRMRKVGVSVYNSVSFDGEVWYPEYTYADYDTYAGANRFVGIGAATTTDPIVVSFDFFRYIPSPHARTLYFPDPKVGR